jgi:large subunit ribosomal protein L9
VEVILLEDVEKVGLRGDVVNVARGYARNFLLPRRLAEQATRARVAELRRLEERRARHEANTFEDAQRLAARLGDIELRFDVNAGPTGTLFGSVTPSDIVDRLWDEHKVRVDRRKVGIETIKRIGRYQVPIELFQDVTAEVRTLVVPEGGELPPEEELEAMQTAEQAEQAAAEAPKEELDLDALDAAAAAQDPQVAAEGEITASCPRTSSTARSTPSRQSTQRRSRPDPAASPRRRLDDPPRERQQRFHIVEPAVHAARRDACGHRGESDAHLFPPGVELASKFPLAAPDSSTAPSGAPATMRCVLPANMRIRHVENSVVQR